MACQPKQPDGRIDTQQFVDWCERQVEQSMDMTARIIMDGVHDGHKMVKFRIREAVRDDPEDIILIKGRDVDILRFESGTESRQFHMHKRDVTFHEKTLIVRTTDGREICRAGTGTKNKRGPFPI